MSAPSSPGTAPKTPWRFIVIAVVVTAVLAALIGYLGVTGQLGGVIPGTSHPGSVTPTHCEGNAGAGPFHFTFVAGVRGGYNFNGTVPGPCVLVLVGSHITVTFENSPDAGLSHSWVLIPAGGTATSYPAFPGAGFANATSYLGIPPGASATFTFTAALAGSYQYICEVAGHFDAGMHGWFNVTAAKLTTDGVDGVGAAPLVGAGIAGGIPIAGTRPEG